MFSSLLNTFWELSIMMLLWPLLDHSIILFVFWSLNICLLWSCLDIQSSFQYISIDEVPQLDYLKLPLQVKLIPGLRSRRDASPSPDESVTLSIQDFKMEPGSAVLPSSTVISLAVPLMRLSNQATPTFPSVTQDHSTVIADNSSLHLQTPIESTVKPAKQNFTIAEVGINIRLLSVHFQYACFIIIAGMLSSFSCQSVFMLVSMLCLVILLF